MNREQFYQKQYEIMRDKYFEMVDVALDRTWHAGFQAGVASEREQTISLEGIIEEVDK